MSSKHIYFLVIIAAIYTSIMVDYPNPTMKALGYNQALQWYGEVVSSRTPVDILYNPGLRNLNVPVPERNIAAVVPGTGEDYPQILDGFLEKGYRVIVECSGLDAWHTTLPGRTYLRKMHKNTYRVVVFDGGHHLPTLGMEPDIIIIPRTNGYAAHAHMVDGMKVERITALAREAGCPAVIASVPRWGLVKARSSLIQITARIITASPKHGSGSEVNIKAGNRVSRYGDIIFAYINGEYIENPDKFIGQIEALGVSGAHKICLAFDYRYTDIASADDYCNRLSQYYRLPVQRVNEPIKVANAILANGVEEHELPQPGYNLKNQ